MTAQISADGDLVLVTKGAAIETAGVFATVFAPHLERALGPDLVGGVAAVRLRVAPDVTEERHHLPGAEVPTVVLLRQGGGYGRTRRVGTEEAALVGASDGELTVAQVGGALATLLEGAGDAQAVTERLCALVPELVIEGFVTL